VVALRSPPEPALPAVAWPANGEVLPMTLALAGLALAGFTAWAALRWLSRSSSS
jgi:hypothetical protein